MSFSARLSTRSVWAARVLAIPPDITRLHSQAGALTQAAWRYYGDRLKAVLPALGTHTPLRPDQISHMFGDMPHGLFRVHNWRTDIETVGEVPAEFIQQQSEGKLNFAWPAQVNRLLLHGGFDLILSIGQVVPHEVIGMANYNKNILVGTGGREGINRSHYLGAVYGMERIMGRADNPVRRGAQLRLRPFSAQRAHRLRADCHRAQAGRRAGGARPLHRRRPGMFPARRRTQRQGQLRNGGRAHPQGGGLSRPARVSTPPGSATRRSTARAWLLPTAPN